MLMCTSTQVMGDIFSAPQESSLFILHNILVSLIKISASFFLIKNCFVGHRGVLVEVFPNMQFADILDSPHSQSQFVHESLILHNNNVPPLDITSQTFSLRVTGFFIPPKTSLYTSNVLSVNGECQLYFVNGSSDRRLIASSPPGTYHG